MVNPIFDAMNGENQNKPVSQNDIAEMFTNFVNNFSSNVGGMRPEQIGPQLVQSGYIPNQQYQKFRQIANMVTGMNK